jgi:hypothetical protein
MVALELLWENWMVKDISDYAQKLAIFFPHSPAIEWLEDVGPFDAALVLLGINDAAKGLAGDFKTHYSSIVATLAALPFKPEIYLAKPLPMLSREFDTSSQTIAGSVEEVGRNQGACAPCI